MTTSPSIAVVHYPEGAGHATRMLAVANALADAGAEVSVAGGGAGQAFVALNGYDAFEPTAVDYIDTYQGGSLRGVLARSLPATTARVTELVRWLRETDPDAVVTDDMFAAMAAVRTDTRLYALKHDLPALYDDRIERAGAAFHTDVQRTAAERLFYPAVWPRTESEPDGVTRVPPVALTGAAEPEPRDVADVFVVPSHYSELDRIAGTLDAPDYDVTNVADDDWETTPSLLPYLRAADLVICSGYSTVMDAAVAETPCIVHPATDEQRAVADRIERFDLDGFAVAETPFDVVEAVTAPPGAPNYENGADRIARSVLRDVETEAPDETEGDADPETGRVRAAAATATEGLARVGAAGRDAASVAIGGLRRGVERSVAAGRTLATEVTSRVRATASGCRRYAAASVVALLVGSVFVRGRTARSGRRFAGAVRAGGGRLRGAATRVGVGAARALSDVADRLRHGVRTGIETAR
ncbi:hypothetical protein [Haloplanus salilacus]|uniref:glycosyltransferase n=1 Tax=Haloplanus salilacus TaxID=2949994 RepID=UPI0030D01393